MTRRPRPAGDAPWDDKLERLRRLPWLRAAADDRLVELGRTLELTEHSPDDPGSVLPYEQDWWTALISGGADVVDDSGRTPMPLLAGVVVRRGALLIPTMPCQLVQLPARLLQAWPELGAASPCEPVPVRRPGPATTADSARLPSWSA